MDDRGKKSSQLETEMPKNYSLKNYVFFVAPKHSNKDVLFFST